MADSSDHLTTNNDNDATRVKRTWRWISRLERIKRPPWGQRRKQKKTRDRERERERHIKETSSANINISRRAKRKIDTIDVSVTHFLLMH